ncbi:MAG: hypothetical protein ACR2Q4_08695, partial [Geminicoccaceae bacterium]
HVPRASMQRLGDIFANSQLQISQNNNSPTIVMKWQDFTTICRAYSLVTSDNAGYLSVGSAVANRHPAGFGLIERLSRNDTCLQQVSFYRPTTARASHDERMKGNRYRRDMTKNRNAFQNNSTTDRGFIEKAPNPVDKRDTPKCSSPLRLR